MGILINNYEIIPNRSKLMLTFLSLSIHSMSQYNQLLLCIKYTNYINIIYIYLKKH